MSHQTLTERIETWMVDTDADFTDQIDNIIALGEMRVARALNTDAVRHLVTGSLTIHNNALARAATIIGVLWFSITVGTRKVLLDLRQDSYLRFKYADPLAAEGQPIEYAITDQAAWMLGPTPDQAYPYEMMTEQRVVGLSATVETWLSTRFDDLLFYSCCLESGALEKDSDEEKRYGGMFDAALQAAQAEVNRGRSDSLSLSRSA